MVVTNDHPQLTLDLSPSGRHTTGRALRTSTRCNGATSSPRIVPTGPDLSGWLAPHRREELGGRPFGEGNAPGPPPLDEAAPAAHRPSPQARPETAGT